MEEDGEKVMRNEHKMSVCWMGAVTHGALTRHVILLPYLVFMIRSSFFFFGMTASLVYVKELETEFL